MMTSQTAMGVAVAATCGLGLIRSNWLFENTRNGRRFADWFGETGGLATLRALLVVGVFFGVLLATDVIRPIKW